MEGSEQPSSLQSMCHVRASEIFPKVSLETEDSSLTVPFIPICGESIEYLGRTSDGVLALSNYRLYLQLKDTYYNIPLGLIELIEVRDIFFLHIGCKDARSLRCTFTTNELCLEWFRRLHKSTTPGKNIEDIFAFAFYAWSSEEGGEEVTARLRNFHTHKVFNFNDEVKRLKFDIHGAWRVSQANLEYKLSPSYPRQLLVPACITDEVLETVSRFRSSRRIPAVVWRHTGNGAVIARCSQPEVGWLGWRSSEDEDLLKAVADACAYDRGSTTMMDGPGSTDIDAIANGADDSESAISQGKKVLIMDARSYTTAVANRARGGGVECPEYYPSCDIQFMNLANIHSIRKSFHALRLLCSTAADQPNWFGLLEGTRWLQHMSGLLRAALTVVSSIEEEGRPVLVHCSDGWDRTSQIVSLAELLLDPYYRTLNGFQVLVEREWLDFGHKFADRCGHTVGPDDPNERCPVFLQWLDCVHQVTLQFPCAFEFSSAYLVKLAQHVYSNLFGTFLGNSLQERQRYRINERTFSAWNFLRDGAFRNHLFSAKERVIWPSCKVRDLVVWCEVYLGAGETSIPTTMLPTPPERPESPLPEPEEVVANGQLPLMSKTRSYDDLVAAQEHVDTPRRSSDPNLTLEILTVTTNDEETEPKPDLVSNTDSEPEENAFNSCQSQSLDVSDNEESEATESPSEITIYSSNNANEVKPLAAQSVESSTDTLVAEIANTINEVASVDSVPAVEVTRDVFFKEGSLVNGLMKGGSAVNGSEHVLNGLSMAFNVNNGGVAGEDCRVCASSRRFLADKDSGSSSASGKTSRYSTPPLYSRTPSSGYPTPNEEREPLCEHRCRNASRLDGVDGLAPVQSDVQTRLHQIITEHKVKEEALQRDLHSTRLALIQQVCHHCSHNHERQDDTGSLPESVYSEHVSAGESLPSDVSWEAIDDAGPTLWVPDHAVSHCMGCNTTFWIGRRKHHCRNCGKIFCSDCSENTVPLPDEQLYNPVRVCTACYSLLNPNLTSYTSDQPSLGSTEPRPVSDSPDFDLEVGGCNGIAKQMADEIEADSFHSTRDEHPSTNGQTNGRANGQTNGYVGANGSAKYDQQQGCHLEANGFGDSERYANGYPVNVPAKCSNGIDQTCGSETEANSCTKSVVTAVST